LLTTLALECLAEAIFLFSLTSFLIALVTDLDATAFETLGAIFLGTATFLAAASVYPSA